MAELRQPIPDRQGDDEGTTGTAIASSGFGREKSTLRVTEGTAERARRAPAPRTAHGAPLGNPP